MIKTYFAPDAEACCREKGVPEVCFGYCKKPKKPTSNDGKLAMMSTGICGKWFEVIGKCMGGRYKVNTMYDIWL